MSDIDNRELSSLIGEIYDCAIDPALWPATLERICGALRTCDATIYSQDPASQQIFFGYSWGIDPYWIRLYAEKYLPLNPALTFGWHAEIDQPGSVATFLPIEEFRRTRFYEEWCRPQGFCDAVVAVVAKSARVYTAITASRQEAVGPTGEREFAIMRYLAPHIRRAVTIHGLVDRNVSRAADFASALDLVPTPVLLFDADARCVEANAAAERLLAETRVLRVGGGPLTGDLDTSRQITAMIAAAAAGDASLGGNGIAVVLPDPDRAERRFVGHRCH